MYKSLDAVFLFCRILTGAFQNLFGKGEKSIFLKLMFHSTHTNTTRFLFFSCVIIGTVIRSLQNLEPKMYKTGVDCYPSLQDFQTTIELKYDQKFDNYWDFQCWTITNSDSYWAEAWDYFRIIHSAPYTKVMEANENFEVPNWFPGARLNYAENLLTNTSNDVAIILAGEERDEPEIVTFCDLKDEVAILASALRKAGIGKGDMIACFMSNRKEAIVSMLAAASIGAISSSTNPLMGPQAVIDRFCQVSPKVLFTIDRFLYNSEEKNFLRILPQITNDLPSLQNVIIVASNEKSLERDISVVKHSCFYADFLETGLNSDGSVPAPYYEQLPFDHPLITNFTSGTTGSPKGLVHSAGGAFLSALINLCFNGDVRKADVAWTIFSPGWITFNIHICALRLDACNVIFEGVPFRHKKFTFWDMVDKFKVTYAMLSTPTVEDILKHQLIPGPRNSLNSLRTLISGASHVRAHLFDFVHNQIKKDLNYAIVYGATEFCSMFGGFDPNLPIHKEEIQLTPLGIDICCYNEKGQRIFDEFGELVICNPFPSMPLCIWNDLNNERYKSYFFNTFPGVWRHGDICKVNSETHGLILIGRSDETIKQRGARFGSSDIYNIVNKLDGIVDSICVSVLSQSREEIAVLCVKITEGSDFTPELEQSIRKAISVGLTFRHVPDIICPVKDIPYNINMKKMEVLVKKILANSTNLSTESASNPECLEEYKKLAIKLQL